MRACAHLPHHLSAAGTKMLWEVSAGKPELVLIYLETHSLLFPLKFTDLCCCRAPYTYKASVFEFPQYPGQVALQHGSQNPHHLPDA